MSPGVRGCWAWLAEFPLLFLPTPEPMGFSPLPSCSQTCHASAWLLCLLLACICAFKQPASPLGWVFSFVFTVGINQDLQRKGNLQRSAPCLLFDLGNAAGLGSRFKSGLFFKERILGVLWEEGVSLSALGRGLSWAWHPLGLGMLPPSLGPVWVEERGLFSGCPSWEVRPIFCSCAPTNPSNTHGSVCSTQVPPVPIWNVVSWGVCC